MSPPWVPPRRAYHLRVFAVSLGLLFVSLAVFLLGVRMEAVEPATGIITARDLCEVRASLPGLIEPGWFEAEIADEAGRLLHLRLDAQGNGLVNPVSGHSSPVHDYLVEHGPRVPPDCVRFHRLQAGDELWPGQLLASIRGEERRFQLKQAEERLRQWQSAGNRGPEYDHARAEAEALRNHLALSQMHVPDTDALWMAVRVRVTPEQAVLPGDVVAAVVPVDPATHHPLGLVARLEVEEKHCGEIAPGQTVRLFSAMYNHRLHGHAEGIVERVEPWGEAATDGGRRFTVIVPVMDAPFSLALGSSVHAKIVVGRKVVYRIILEH
jgi:hypothetical protein